MKTRLFICLAMIAALAISTLAQITITPNKTTYTRESVAAGDYKRTFDVTYPVVGGIASEGVRNKLNDTLSYWKTFDMTLEESLGDYTWLDSLDFNVVYNKGNILTIELIMEGAGAYPDGQIKTYVVDLRNGKRVFFNDVFNDFGKLIVMIDKAHLAEKKAAIAEAKKENSEDSGGLEEMLREKSFSVKTLEEFSVDSKGVTFIYHYDFVHAVKAMEPEGRYFFNWTQLKPFIKDDGLLASFKR